MHDDIEVKSERKEPAPVMVIMRPNGLVGSWMVRGPQRRMFMTGLTEEATETLGRKWAEGLGIPFKRVGVGCE